MDHPFRQPEELIAEGSKLKAKKSKPVIHGLRFSLLLFVLGLFLFIAQAGGAEKIIGMSRKTPSKPTLELGTKTYNWYCSACHGAKGDGKGFNAEHLFVKPADHTDPAFMSGRSDDKLYDVINLGGKGISKSALMPPWGAAIGDVRISALILKLRDLCNCSAKEGG